jgi:hypothetical protein
MVRALRKAGSKRVPDIFDEVDEDLRADQARALLRRYGGLLILAMLLTLAGVGVYHSWRERQEAAAEAIGSKFLAAQDKATTKFPPKDLPQQFADIAATAPDGYRTLARLHLAVLDWNRGQHDSAIAEWQSIADDSAAPQLLRDLANLTSVQHQLDSANPQTLKAKLLPLIENGGRWRPLAEQLTALLDLRLGRATEAKQIIKSLVQDPQVPPGIRQTSQDLLMTLDATPADDTNSASKAGTHG